MTEQQARTTANVVMAAAAFGAAVIVLRSPRLRRLVAGLAKASAGPLAAYAATTVRDAWSESASDTTSGDHAHAMSHTNRESRRSGEPERVWGSPRGEALG